ncbi:alpha/beta fold hydrolase [Photobacterium sp. WH24]|uniref:esterase/lipase family protein n=1 Tax=Photobacterium sp. WH24 TaxID=2827237 RepID=UPI001C4508E1|nr:alpha/beta fold hydrolase [Photobacterium sp. WH24]MBV7263887.1 alpha/beta fold hydrolase [Photobacterium sp. WH24]
MRNEGVKVVLLLVMTVVSVAVKAAPSQPPGCVILLHGLARTANAMDTMTKALELAGYQTVNMDYPSTTASIESLAASVIPAALSQCQHIEPVHFVTHSMGGILVRQYLSANRIAGLGRVVMLAPPNKGSEIVDAMRDFTLYQWIYGPAGQQLGTDKASVPNTLGPVQFELGVIAGNYSISLLTSWLLPLPHDGKVSVVSTQVEGMQSHLVLPVSHTFIMNNHEVIAQTMAFLRQGRFIDNH